MKIDRILGIIVYLLNHDCVSAGFLAEYFHVSVRTIQRDIICISNIGIPLYSANGKNGGYSIMQHYRLRNMNIHDDEQQIIRSALESLATSYTNDTLKVLIEKYNALIEREGGQKIFWDFSITRENKRVQMMNDMLAQAIRNRNYIRFDYRNARDKRSEQYVEPLAIHYKWYAWYLFSYSEAQKKYKTFKVARIHRLSIVNERATASHEAVEILMKRSEQEYYATCLRIEIRFTKEEADLVEEYFPDCLKEKVSEHEYKALIRVPAGERLWKALLLSFGDRIKVLSPEKYRRELIETAKGFLANYDIQLSR